MRRLALLVVVLSLHSAWRRPRLPHYQYAGSRQWTPAQADATWYSSSWLEPTTS